MKGGGGGRSNGNYSNPCLTMHQPRASLLVYGIKRIEGRSWPAPMRGRLWIHAASRVPEEATIKAMEDFYREIYAVNGVTDIKFPEHYPVSRLLVPFVPQVRLEGQTDFCWLREQPKKLLVPFEMRGYQGVYNLEKKIYEAVVGGLIPVEGPMPVKFPLPDPWDNFSLKPGSISVLFPETKASEVEKSSSVTVAIAASRAAASQFKRKDQSLLTDAIQNTNPYSTRSSQSRAKSLEEDQNPLSKLHEGSIAGSSTSKDIKQEESCSSRQTHADLKLLPGAPIFRAAVQGLKPS